MGHLSFLSTPSARRATCECIVDIDSTTEFLSTPSARRATGHAGLLFGGGGGFLSTPSARRATAQTSKQTRASPSISIHALREEGDIVKAKMTLTMEISIHALREEGDCGRYQVR